MKKWTYLVAACMLAGTTPVLTGCIDNDEPAGIEQLRVAKSELIKAKVALVEAEKGKMEAEKLKIEMEAEIARAKAAILDAYAEKQAALAQAAKDSAEYIAQIYDLKIQEEQARVNKSIAEYKQKEAEAEAKYQEALKDIELAKLTLSAEQWTNLAHYTDAVDDAKADYDYWQATYEQALKTQTDALRAYTDDQGDTRYKNSLVQTVRLDSIKLVEAKEALADAEELAAKPIEATAWDEEKAKLEEELAVLEQQEADLKVVGAKFDAEHAEELTAMKDSLAKALAMGAKVIYEDKDGTQVTEYNPIAGSGLEIPGYEFSSETDMFEGIQIEVSIPENGEYFYQDYIDNMEAIENGETSVEILAGNGVQPFVALAHFDKAIREANLFALNENEEQWKQNDIARLDADLKKMQAEYEEAYKEWDAVKNAYNHVSTVTNPTQLPVGATLNEKITAYNTAAAANKAAIDAMDAAEKTFIEALKKADENATAVTDYANIHTVLEAEVTTQTTNVVNAKTVYDSAVTALEALQNDPNATNQQIQDAQKAVDDALKEMQDANTLLATAQANLTAIDNANTAYTTAETAVKGDGTDANKGTKKLAAEAYTAVVDAYVAYVNYLVGSANFDWTVDYLGTMTEITNVEQPDAAGNIYVTAMDAAKALEVSQDQMMGALKVISQKVWGTAWLRPDDQMRILPVTKEEVDANIQESYAQENAGEKMPEYLVQFRYSIGYGLFGQTLSLQAALTRAQEYLNGGDAEIKRITDEITAMKSELQKTIDDNNKMVEDLVAFFMDANQKYNEAYQAEVGDLIAANTAEQLKREPVIEALKKAIEGYLYKMSEVMGESQQATIEDLKDRLAEIVDNAKRSVTEAEESLAYNRERLEKFWKEGTDGDSTLRYALDDANANVERAQEKRDAAKEAYDAAVAELQAILDALSAE